MDSQLENIRDLHKDAWNKSSAGWKKWDVKMMEFLRPMNDAIIRNLDIKEDNIILDVATGTGEPGLTIAKIVTKGKVIGVDLSEQMLQTAKEKAEKLGIKNFETVICDVSKLPFEDNSFDNICCRNGFMIFPDIQIALKEMIRVLKSGGKISTSVWGPADKNTWVCNSMEIMIQRLGLKRPAPGATGIYRCAESGMLAEYFKQAGLKNIEETPVQGKLYFDSIDTYWEFITEAASPVAFASADEETKEKIKNEVLSKIRQINPGNTIELDSYVLIITGRK